jgi:hypothetical protein
MLRNKEKKESGTRRMKPYNKVNQQGKANTSALDLIPHLLSLPPAPNSHPLPPCHMEPLVAGHAALKVEPDSPARPSFSTVAVMPFSGSRSVPASTPSKPPPGCF